MNQPVLEALPSGELLSSNEELHIANEELQTAIEELTSSNEELNSLNEELQQRTTDLSHLTDDLNQLLVGIEIPIVMIDTELRIRRFTPAAVGVLNLKGGDLGRPLTDVAPRLRSVKYGDLVSELIAKKKPIHKQVQDREGRWFDLRMRSYTSKDHFHGILIALVDIDVIRRSVEEAGKARQRSRMLASKLALVGDGVGIGVWEFDVRSAEIRGTKQWSDLHGLPAGAALSIANWLARVHPDDQDPLHADLNELLKGCPSTNREYRVHSPDGHLRWINHRTELVRDSSGAPVKINGVSIDITARKLSEQQDQILSFRVAAAQDEERERIARELHDGLVQDLAALAMDLGRLAAKSGMASNGLKQEFQSFQQRAIKSAATARHLAYVLHPSELDDLGFTAALLSFCQQIEHDHGITVKCTLRKVPKRLAKEIAAALYKVAQEGLRNVVKHSQARSAAVLVQADGRRIRLEVRDYGRGFHLSSLQGCAGLGISSIRERVHLLNGTLDIHAKPGAGTQIIAEVPLEATRATQNIARR